MITALDPPAIAAGSSGFTLSVNGTGMTNGAVIRWNGSDRPTLFVGSTQLTATITSADVAQMGEAKVTVAGAGGTSAEARFTVYQSVGVTSADMVFDPFTRRLFLSLPNLNSLAPIDPQSGVQGTATLIGLQPGRLAIAEDGAAIFAGLDGAGTVRRFDVTANALSAVISLGTDTGSGQPLVAKDIAVLPGNSHAIAVATQTAAGQGGGVAMWDDGVKRGLELTASGGVKPVALRFVGTGNLYGTSNDATPVFYRMGVTGSGLTLTDATAGTLPAAEMSDDGTFLYSAAGAVLDPSKLQAQAGFFSPDGAAALGNNSRVALEAGVDRAVFATAASLSSGGGTAVLFFKLQDRSYAGRIDLPGVTGVDGILRWSSDGLALHSPSQIILLRTSQLTPGSGANPAPVMSSLAPNPIVRGSSNTEVTLSGSQFVPGAIVLWNGNERDTSFVSAAELRMAIPASDLAQAGANTVVVRNPAPGGGDSAQMTLNVVRPVPTIVLPASVGFGQALAPNGSSAQSIGLQNQGPGELQVTSAQTSGDFLITQSCPTLISANTSCSYNVAFHPAGFGARSGTLTIIDSGLAKTYSVQLSGIGDMQIQMVRPVRPGRDGQTSSAARGSMAFEADVAANGQSGFSFTCSAEGFDCQVGPAPSTTDGGLTRITIKTQANDSRRARRLQRNQTRAVTVTLTVKWGATTRDFQVPLQP